MEKDAKIGLVIGLVFVVALIAFLAWRSYSESKQNAAAGATSAPADEFKSDFGSDNTTMPLTGEPTAAALTPPAPIAPALAPAPTTPAPTTVTPPPAPAPETTTYTVKTGDSLWKIAEQVYGDGTKQNLIAEANKDVIKDRNKLSIGMKLVIPAASGRATAGGASMPTETGKYTIKKGDTLEALAKRFYGDGAKWKRIQDANPGLDPKNLRIGAVISIPSVEGAVETAPAPTPDMTPAPAAGATPGALP